MYHVQIWYMCTLWKDSPHWVNYHIHHLMQHIFVLFLMRTFKIYSLSKFQLYNIAFSAAVSMLYMRSSEFIYLIFESAYSFTQLCLFPPASSPWKSLSYSVSDFFFFKIPDNWNHVLFVLLWLISLSIIPSIFIHVATNGSISFCF